MPEQLPSLARLSREAEADLDDILDWNETTFGHGAALRYAELIIQALRDVQYDPVRLGAKLRPELPKGVYTYHLASSRERVAGDQVKAPRHFLLYRVADVRVEFCAYCMTAATWRSICPRRKAVPPQSVFTMFIESLFRGGQAVARSGKRGWRSWTGPGSLPYSRCFGAMFPATLLIPSLHERRTFQLVACRHLRCRDRRGRCSLQYARSISLRDRR